MFSAVIYNIPCIVCILWALVYLFRKKTRSQKSLLVMLLIGVFYFFSFSIYISPFTNYSWMVRLDFVCEPLVLGLLAQMVIYAESHIPRPIFKSSFRHLMYAPAMIHLGVIFVLYYLMSFEQAALFTEAYDKAATLGGDPFTHLPAEYTTKLHHLYRLIDFTAYSYICLAFVIAIVTVCVISSMKQKSTFKNIFKFFKHEDYSAGVHIINLFIIGILLFEMPLIVFGRSYVLNHPIVGMAISLSIAFCIFFGSYVEFVSNVPVFKDNESETVDEQPQDVEVGQEYETTDSEDSSAPLSEDVEKNDRPDEVVEQTSKSTNTNDVVPFEYNKEIDAAFIRSMEVDKVYTDASLTIEILAKKLETNRFTLSTLVNKKYGMTFKTMLATYRLEYAKQYMLDNPSASVDEVAAASGFGDRSSFFHKFKDVIGMSPKVWLTKQ